MTESALSLLGCSNISRCTWRSFIFVTVGCWWPGSVSPFKEIASLASGLRTTVKWSALVWSFFGNCATKQREVIVLVARIGWKSRTPRAFVRNVNISNPFDIQGPSGFILMKNGSRLKQINTAQAWVCTVFSAFHSYKIRFKCIWISFCSFSFYKICVKYVP